MNEQTQTTQTTAKSTHSAQSLVTIALMAAVLCVSAYISIPLPNGSHITALNFIVIHTGILFDQFDLVFTRTFGTSGSYRRSFRHRLRVRAMGWLQYRISYRSGAGSSDLHPQIQPCSLYHYRHSFCCFCRSVWQYLDDGCKRYCSGSCSCSRIPAIYRFGCGKSGDRSTDRTSDP